MSKHTGWRFESGSFVITFIALTLIIAVAEFLVMEVLARLPETGVVLNPSLEGMLDAGLLTVMSAPLVWFVCLRPLQRKISLDRKNIEEKSRRNAKLRRALDACQEMILITDGKGRIRYTNPALCRFTGYQEEDLVGQSPAVLDSPHADPEVLAAMNAALKAGQPWSGRVLGRRFGPKSFPVAIEGQTQKPDEFEYWAGLHVTPIMDRRGNLVGYVQIQRDVSAEVEREKFARMEKADSEARLRIAEILAGQGNLEQRIKEVLEVLFELDGLALQRKGGLFRKNGEVLDMFVLHGQFTDEFREKESQIPLGVCLCGKAALSGELLVSDDCFCDPRHEHQFEGMKSHGHYIIPVAQKDEVLGILFLYTDPYPEHHPARLATLRQLGEMLGLALLQQEAHETLQEARDQAQAQAQAKSAFLANMSHEIRTPMNGVLGMLDLLKETPMSHEQQELVRTAVNSADALLEILNDILDLSKLEAGKVEIERTRFVLPDLLEEVCTLLAPRAHSKKLDLNLFLPPELSPVREGDHTRIRQVLTNLIGNAIKFTEEGEVTVSVREQQPGELLFEVHDTGIGISPKAQSRLFQPFDQADVSTTRRFGGTGLGLSISKRLVELMAGVIGVDSAYEKGSRFWFKIPLSALNDETVETKPLADLTGKRALVVDDNATNRKILDAYLKHFGLEVVDAIDGEEALQLLNEDDAFDIVLTDMHMPRLDGAGLASAMAVNPRLAPIPRMLLSSGVMISVEDRRRLGIVKSLLKPVRRNMLKSALEEILAGSSKQQVVDKPSSDAAWPGCRILVAEDNPVNCKVITTRLKKLALQVEVVENGAEALERLKSQTYDLVLMDCQMPIMDGYEATRRLRSRELEHRLSRIPVIALTAHVGEGEREKCLSCGMDDYLSKPVRAEMLTQMLSRYLGSPAKNDDALTKQEPAVQSQPEDSPPQRAVCDLEAALTQLDHDRELLDEMIDLCLEDLPHRLDDLRTAQTTADVVGLAEAAHAIKGMAGHFFADELTAQARELEQLARQGDCDADGVRTQALLRIAEKVMQTLKKVHEAPHVS